MKVLEEKNGYKFGINDNPNIIGTVVEEKRYQIEFPNGEHLSGNKSTVRKLYDKYTG
jgi:hypothetical protein